MAFEIEIKAHVQEMQVPKLVSFFEKYPGSVSCGKTDKQDIYWAKKVDNPPIFRIRLEKNNSSSNVIFTSKPLKTKAYLIEYNIENEFKTGEDQWEYIIKFLKGLNLVVCRKKRKTGYGFLIPLSEMTIHAELLNVSFLGWFLEMEITSDEQCKLDKKKAEQVLFALYDQTGLPREFLEPLGYNKMLSSVGHSRG